MMTGWCLIVTTPDNKTTRYKHDVLGRVSAIEYPDGYRTEAHYDDGGNVTRIIVPTAQAHEFEANK
ncbi:MAG: RHS repeat protein [Reinekea sp.]